MELTREESLMISVSIHQFELDKVTKTDMVRISKVPSLRRLIHKLNQMQPIHNGVVS